MRMPASPVGSARPGGGARPGGDARPGSRARRELGGADLRDHLARHLAGLEAALPFLAEVEPVHDVRVRARRLRSLLRSHRAFLPPGVGDGRVRAILDDLRWLGRVVGAVRDVDVMAEHLALVEVDEYLRLGWLSDLQTERAAALARASRRLAGPRVARLVKRLHRVIDSRGWSVAAKPTTDAVLPGQRRRVLELAERALALPARGPEEVEAWHDVRKAAKELRYAAEAFTASDPGATRWAGAGRSLQTVLGRQLDRERVASWLDAFALLHETDPALASGSLARATVERRLASRRNDRGRQAAVGRVRDLA